MGRTVLGLVGALVIGCGTVAADGPVLDRVRVTVRVSVPETAYLVAQTPEVLFTEEEVAAGFAEGPSLLITRAGAIRLEYFGNVVSEIQVSSPQGLVHQRSGEPLPPERLSWRLDDDDPWRPFTGDMRRLALQQPGRRILSLDLQLSLQSTDPVGEYRTMLTFTVLAPAQG